jgi:hypothetical protein
MYRALCTKLCVFIKPKLNTPLVLEHVTLLNRGPSSSVGIATDYGLDGPGIGSRWGRDFPHLFQTGPWEVHPTSCTMGTGSFPGVKGPGRGADNSSPSNAKVMEE